MLSKRMSLSSLRCATIMASESAEYAAATFSQRISFLEEEEEEEEEIKSVAIIVLYVLFGQVVSLHDGHARKTLLVLRDWAAS